jgi:hypothetical protein
MVYNGNNSTMLSRYIKAIELLFLRKRYSIFKVSVSYGIPYNIFANGAWRLLTRTTLRSSTLSSATR